MVDRAYKGSLPQFRRELESVRERFSKLDSDTDWVQLRVDPMLRHLDSLEHLLKSRKFSREFARLRKGVVLFHSDLVYLRTNLIGLKKLLRSEEKSSKRATKRN